MLVPSKRIQFHSYLIKSISIQVQSTYWQNIKWMMNTTRGKVFYLSISIDNPLFYYPQKSNPNSKLDVISDSLALELSSFLVY